MKSSDTRLIPHSREQVFDALTRTDILQLCIPGCERIDQTDDGKLNAVIAAKVGPVRAKFEAMIDITEAVRPESYKAVGEGKGAAGMASGTASATLSDENGSTRLNYEFEAKIGGKIAQLGSRVIDSFSKKFANDFFEKFEAVMTADLGGEPVNAPQSNPAATKSSSQTNKFLLIGIAVLAVVGVVYFLAN